MPKSKKFLIPILLALTIVVGVFSTAQSMSSREDFVIPSHLKNSAPATLETVVQHTIAVPIQIAEAAEPVVPVVPTHLDIPNARVHAEVVPVGVTATNNLDVPPNFIQAGWYQYGAKPGEKGNAVLDGHVDNGASIDGVFKHLRDLKPGDDIYVTGANGVALTFKVIDSAVYETKKFPSDSIFNQNDGRALLKIITCHGTYVPSVNTYDHRLVVTAILAE